MLYMYLMNKYEIVYKVLNFWKLKKGEIYKLIIVDLFEFFLVECIGDKILGIMVLNVEVCNKIWIKR